MSQAYLTYNGLTKPVAQWGLRIDAALEKQNQGKHTVTVKSIERFDVGLAQALYNEWSVLQFDGSHKTATNSLLVNNDTIDQGDVVDTTGLNNNYAGLMVQSATHYLGKRIRNLEFGVPAHLSVQDYIRLMMLWRYRYRWHNPAEAVTGQPAGGSQIDLGTEHRLENTDDGAATPPVDSAISPDTTDPTKTNQIKKDAGTGQITVSQINMSDGTVLASAVVAPTYAGPSAGGPPGPTTLS